MTEILCDNCQSELKQLNADYKDLLECFAEMATYFWVEMSWGHFRAEFMARGDLEYENTHRDNARRIAQFLVGCEVKWPGLKQTIREEE